MVAGAGDYVITGGVDFQVMNQHLPVSWCWKQAMHVSAHTALPAAGMFSHPYR